MWNEVFAIGLGILVYPIPKLVTKSGTSQKFGRIWTRIDEVRAFLGTHQSRISPFEFLTFLVLRQIEGGDILTLTNSPLRIPAGKKCCQVEVFANAPGR